MMNPDATYQRLLTVEDELGAASIALELARRQRDSLVVALLAARNWLEDTHGGEIIEGVGWGDLLDEVIAPALAVVFGTPSTGHHPAARRRD